MERDFLESVVDVSAALGGFAALIAVIVGFQALRIARLDRRDAAAARERAAVLELLTALRELVRDVRQVHSGVNEGLYNANRVAVDTVLALHGLRSRLPRTNAIAQRMYGDELFDWEEDIPAAQAEIMAVVAIELERAEALRA